MKECPTCRRCFSDEINHCPDDGNATTYSIAGETVLDSRYQLERRLGHGGMGVVFQARHIFLKTAHAIKIILPDLVGNDPMLITRFRQEALAAAAIRHQNIIAVTDFGVVRGVMPFLVMEYVKGVSLQDILSAEIRLSPKRALEIMSAVAAGVGAAHKQNIVHRDLKPLNIMLQEGQPTSEGLKVLDFGLAKIKSGELLGSFVQAQTSGLMGSPFYMAPEQWSDEEPDVRADIYSLGVIMFQMLAGEVPFRGNSIPAIMKKHLTSPPPSFASFNVEVPPQVEVAVRRALEKEASHRPASVEDFVAEIREAVARVPSDLVGARTMPMIAKDTFRHSSLGGSSLPSMSPSDTTLYVHSIPPRSRVFINNVSVGVTNDEGLLVIPGMLRGEHRVVVFHEGFPEWGQQVVCAGNDCHVNARLDSIYGRGSGDLSETVAANTSGTISASSLNDSSFRLDEEAYEKKRREQEESDRRAREYELAQQKEAERLKAEEAEARRIAEQEAREKAEKEEEQKREEAERRAALEEAERQTALKLAEEKAAEEERQRIAAEQAEKERQRIAAEKAAEQERQRLAAEKAAEEERQRLAAEKAAAEERARIAAKAKQEAEVEARRKAAEEEERLERKRVAQEQQARIRRAEELRALERIKELEREAEKKKVQDPTPRGWSGGLKPEDSAPGQVTIASPSSDEFALDTVLLPGPDTQYDAARTERESLTASTHDIVEAPATGAVSAHSIPVPIIRPEAAKRGMIIPIIGGVVALILIAGVIGFFAFRPRPTQTVARPETQTAVRPGTGEVKPPEVKPPAVAKADMVEIPGGTFQMGSSSALPQESPAHSVTVAPFSMDRTEVSNADYAEFVAQTNYATPPSWTNGRPPEGKEKLPVSNVSLEDVNAYATWRSKRDGVTYRLPTESEWEFAARNGSEGSNYPWGGSWDDKFANLGTTVVKPVGSYPDGKNKWGNLDLIGNVWEWTSTKIALYPGNRSEIPELQRDWVVIRGGSVNSKARVDKGLPGTTAVTRQWVEPSRKDVLLGFRLAK
jgi:serine/threonine protein kinase/formylglycine-generating enzyme required for sulfatase activity